MKQRGRKESVKGDEETERNTQEQRRRRKKECVWNKSDDSGKVMMGLSRTEKRTSTARLQLETCSISTSHIRFLDRRALNTLLWNAERKGLARLCRPDE
jgi:hypothetical protein